MNLITDIPNVTISDNTQIQISTGTIPTHMPASLKTKDGQFDNFAVTGGTVSCH